MRYKCRKCGDEVRLYGEGIIDTCKCPKKPIGLLLENGEARVTGPLKKIIPIKEPKFTGSKTFTVEVVFTSFKPVTIKASSREEAAWKIRHVMEEGHFDYDEFNIISNSIGAVYEGNPQTHVGFEEEEDE